MGHLGMNTEKRIKCTCKAFSFVGLTRRHAEASVVVQHGEEGRVQMGHFCSGTCPVVRAQMGPAVAMASGVQIGAWGWSQLQESLQWKCFPSLKAPLEKT